jgi:hypothetical protein
LFGSLLRPWWSWSSGGLVLGWRLLVHRLHECAGDVLGYLQAQTCLRTALDIHEQRHASALANRVRAALASLTGQPE